MTTINDIADLIRIIREDPAWAEALRSVLLSKELLELPETFAAFVSETRENFRLVNQRLDTLESDVADLKTGQAELQASIARLESGQAELCADVTELKTGQARMGGEVSRLARRDYETYAACRAPLMAADLLKLDSIETLSTTSVPHWLDDLVLRAQLTGNITPDEGLQLQAADLVLMGHSPDHPELQLLAEISITIQEQDLTRATTRAAILEKITGISTRPMLIGTALEDGLDTAGVIFLEVPDFA